MRNTLQEQYNLIKEGKGSKDFFMRTALRQFSNLITPTLDFDATVNILKQRQIINENVGGIVTKGVEQDWVKLFKEKTLEEIKLGNPGEAAKKALAGEEESLKENEEDYTFYEEEYGNEEINKLLEKLDYLGFDSLGEVINALLSEPISDWDLEPEEKNIIEKWKKTHTVKEDHTNNPKDKYHVKPGDGGGFEVWEGNKKVKDGFKKKEIAQKWANFRNKKQGLTEAKEVKAKIAKTDTDVLDKEIAGYDYKDKSKENIDNLYGQEFLVGYYAEMKDPKNAEKTVDELKKIVAKNLASDGSYYVKKGQFGTKDLGYTDKHPGLGPTKEVKGKFKSSGMEPIKIKESIIKKDRKSVV